MERKGRGKRGGKYTKKGKDEKDIVFKTNMKKNGKGERRKKEEVYTRKGKMKKYKGLERMRKRKMKKE